MSADATRVLIVEDDHIDGHDLRTIVESLRLTAIGPIPGVEPALALVRGIPIDGALLAVRVDGGLSFPVADALEEEAIPYAFVTARTQLVENEPRFCSKPLITKPFRATAIASALRACGIVVQGPPGRQPYSA